MTSPDAADGTGSTEASAWSPSPALVGMAWVLAAAALAATVFSGPPTGRFLTGVAALALLLFALFGTVARPRLSADADGLTVRRLFGRRTWPWGSVRITVSSTRRFGRQVSLLELEGHDRDDEDGETLVVLGWLDLGTEPAGVADALRARRP